MHDERHLPGVAFEPDPETATRVGWILTALLFLPGIVSLLGEGLGWWNDLGQVGATVGTLGSLVVGVPRTNPARTEPR